MSFEMSHGLHSYVDRRVNCAKRLPGCADIETPRAQLMYCAANNLAALRRTSTGRLRWIGTGKLASESRTFTGKVKTCGDFMGGFDYESPIAFTAGIAIERFIDSARKGGRRLPCEPNAESVFEWWVGAGLIQPGGTKWRLSAAFYEREDNWPWPTRYRKHLVQELECVPAFLEWIKKQFGQPRVCREVGRKLKACRERGRGSLGVALWSFEQNPDVETVLDRRGNLVWRAKSSIS